MATPSFYLRDCSRRCGVQKTSGPNPSAASIGPLTPSPFRRGGTTIPLSRCARELALACASRGQPRHIEEFVHFDRGAGMLLVRMILQELVDLAGRIRLQDREAGDLRLLPADVGERSAELDEGVARLARPRQPGICAGLLLLSGPAGHLVTGRRRGEIEDQEPFHCETSGESVKRVRRYVDVL